jgi:transcriptional regulator of aromatic amino acid metabolism
MITMSSSEAVVTYSETEWLPYLTSERRSNLLVSCGASDVEAVATRLMRSSPHPVQTVRLPGMFALPEDRGGTLLLWDVSRLTLHQQICLNDWMGARRSRTQVISLTTTALLPLVEDGRFLEGLYYRMNMVSLFAREGENDLTGPADKMLIPAATSATARVSSIYHRRVAPVMIR